MASQGNHEFALNDARRHNLAHRMLLEEQQRRIETHKVLKASYRSPICPHYTISGHSDCWFCHQNGIAQPSASNDALLRSLTRPHFQPNSTSVKTETPYLTSSASTDDTINHLNQLTTPGLTASTFVLTDDGIYNQEPYRKLISSKPRMPALTPTKAPAATAAAAAAAAAATTALSVLTQPNSVPKLPWKELPVEKGFVPVRIPPTFSHFLSLPDEIRRRIYVYLVHNGVHGLLIPKDLRAYHQAPITRVNRQIRSESIDMVYTENAYNAKSRELVKNGPSFTLLVGDARLKLIRNFAWYTAKRHLFINFSSSTNGSQYKITFDGSSASQEVGAVARERAYEVYEYLKKQGHLTCFTAEHLRTIGEIVLRITPKVKTKVDGESNH